MRKLWLLVFAAVLTVTAIVSAPPEVFAAQLCQYCNQQTGEPCFACCRCGGGTVVACSEACA